SRRTVTADIVEAANRAIGATDRDDRLAEKVEAVIIAIFRDIARVTDQLPARAKYRALLALEKCRVVIDPAGQTNVVEVRLGGGPRWRCSGMGYDFHGRTQ